MAENDPLWQIFVTRMDASGLTLEDLRVTDEVTRRELFESLGFVGDDQANLVYLAHQYFGEEAGSRPPTTKTNSGGTPPTGTTVPTPGTPAYNPPPTTQRTNTYEQNTHQSAGTVMSQNPWQKQNGGSDIDGLSFNNGEVIAYSAISPELPAEFWCPTYNCLVASRDHVVGKCKDEPFISLRQAADSHVRDLSSWNERARGQLNVVGSVLNNLRASEGILNERIQSELQRVDDEVNQVVQQIMLWRDQLKANISGQLVSQIDSTRSSAAATQELMDVYTDAVTRSDPLMANIPPVDAKGKASNDWSLRVLDFVSKLKQVQTESIAMPKLTVPTVQTEFSASTPTEIIKTRAQPLGVQLPDVMDPGYFNFPQPSMGSKVPFTLSAGADAKGKGVLIYNGKTLTRAQDIVPSHHLLLGSQVFHTGKTSWEVHIDRMGPGTGRLLCGITVSGSDGEGVVWDGTRIVGPNEGQVRPIPEEFAWRQGSVLRFYLELDQPENYLTVFYDRDPVSRIPLPANSHGWCPAFSVFGPEDQITVTANTAGRGSLDNKTFADTRGISTLSDGDTVAQLQRQEVLISSLQQQLNAVQTNVDATQFGTQNHVPQQTFNSTSVASNVIDTPGRNTVSTGGVRSGSTYSPELQRLMRFVGS